MKWLTELNYLESYNSRHSISKNCAKLRSNLVSVKPYLVMPNAKSDFYNYGGAQTIKKGFIVTWSKSPIYLVFFVVVDLCNTSREDPFGNYREADLTKLFLSTSPPLVIDFFLCAPLLSTKKNLCQNSLVWVLSLLIIMKNEIPEFVRGTTWLISVDLFSFGEFFVF